MIRAVPKPKISRSKPYLAHARQYPCVACGKPGPGVAHHIRKGNDCGMGIKPSDFRVLALCDHCHTLVHVNPKLFRERNELLGEMDLLNRMTICLVEWCEA